MRAALRWLITLCSARSLKIKIIAMKMYIKLLYRAFLGREADAAGLSSWINVMERGTTREEVFNGFAMSTEFRGLCSQYGH